MPKECPPGFIVRKSYTATRTRTGTTYTVPATCVPDRGQPGKTPASRKIAFGTLKDDELGQYGYKSVARMSEADRRAALRKAIAGIAKDKGIGTHESAMVVLRILNLLMILNRNTTPVAAARFEADRDWISVSYARAPARA